jgi:hypothetical protein
MGAMVVAFTEEQWRGRIGDRSVTYFAYLPEVRMRRPLG